MIFTDFRVFIRTERGEIHEGCPTLHAVRASLERRLTASDIKSGAMDKLLDFDHGRKIDDDHIETKWQNITVCGYLP